MAPPRRRRAKDDAAGVPTLRRDPERYGALREEASRVIAMRVPPEAEGLAPGPLGRSEGESDERHCERAALYDRLFALPDSG